MNAHLKKIANRILRLTNVALISSLSVVSILSETLQPASPLGNSDLDLSASIELSQNVDFGRHFRDLGVEGSILIYDSKNDRVFQHNPQRNLTDFPPASTFKILNSLISLETGVISDELAVLTWDGIPRELPQWNRDLNMREAMKISAVWFYQVLARRVGYNRMQQWVTEVEYGNQQIGKAEEIDRFWLNGKLRITPEDQVLFLQRLYQNKLPFSQRAMSIVKDILINEQTPDYTLRGKTGWYGFGDDSIPNIGWYVGYLEKGENVYYFATNIDIRTPKDAANRIELTRRCLKDLGVL